MEIREFEGKKKEEKKKKKKQITRLTSGGHYRAFSIFINLSSLSNETKDK